jgi:hypothetical protein
MNSIANTLSNKDANGFEREWILFDHPDAESLMMGRDPPVRQRIGVNPAHEHAKDMDDAWALSCAIRDSVLHLQPEAAAAVAAHIRDAHKFRR